MLRMGYWGNVLKAEYSSRDYQILYAIWKELFGLTEGEVNATSTISPSGDLANALLQSGSSCSFCERVMTNDEGSETMVKGST